jgi:hypothetical protein
LLEKYAKVFLLICLALVIVAPLFASARRRAPGGESLALPGNDGVGGDPSTIHPHAHAASHPASDGSGSH